MNYMSKTGEFIRGVIINIIKSRLFNKKQLEILLTLADGMNDK